MDYFHLHVDREQLLAMSSLGLAHLGDSVFEVMVRAWIALHGKAKPKDLHRATVAYVSAPAQAAAMEKHYTTDPETGEQVEEPVSSWSWDALYVDIYAMTEEEAQALRELIASVKYSMSYDETIMNMIAEESAAFFEGGKNAADTAALIQDRVTTYVNEQR